MKIKIESGLIRKDDRDYPELLKKIGKDAPKQIYYKVFDKKTSYSKISSRFTLKGSDAHQKFQNTRFQQESEKLFSSHKIFLKDIFNNCLAVVGSRKLTNYGKQAIERLVGEIAMNGITIVSGFMYGGDAEAHKTAVKVGGRTIAVMPCGIDRISPEDQEELYNDIIKNNGLIVSEYEGDMAPALWTYPRRNRIVAGLCKAVLVVEAGEKSGSLITASLAKKFGRKIFALPGPITSSVSIGTNALIKEGAEMVTDAKGILKWFGGNKVLSLKRNLVGQGHYYSRHRPSSQLASLQKNIDTQILDLLGREAVGMDEMSRKLEISVSELSVKLSMMEMQGKIKLEGGRYYCEQ